MWRETLLLVALCLPAAAAPRSFAARCKEACLQHVKEPRLQATVCGRCFLEGSSDRGGWALALAEVTPLPRAALDSAIADPDWAVRWGAHRALALFRGVEVARELAERVGEGQGEPALTACLTALRGAASRKLSLHSFFEAAGARAQAANASCTRKAGELQRALEVELYGGDRELQAEALAHLSSYLGVPPAKAVLLAMRSRDPASDSVAALALLEEANRGGLPVGLALLRAATSADRPQVDRLLALYAASIDALRPQLGAAEPATRKEAIGRLSALGPLGAPELEPLLLDEDLQVALLAGKALARGEGQSLARGLRSRLALSGSPSAQVRVLELAGRAAEPECAAVLAEVGADPSREEAVRGAAYAALGACAGAGALHLIRPALRDPSPLVRAGAVSALAAMPRVVEAERFAASALEDPAPEVLAAAVLTVAAQRQSGQGQTLSELLTHSNPAVRAAAAQGLGLLGDRQSAKPVAERLSEDPEPEVRIAAAKALGTIGGPFVLSALTAAAGRDPNSRVRYVAKESLRRLGFQR